MNASLAVTNCTLLTPLDAPSRGTWEALCAQRRVGRRRSVDEALLEGDTGLDRSIRLGLAVGRRALAGRGGAGVSLFCGTSKGPVETMLGACARVGRGEALRELEARQVALGAGAMGAILRETLGIEGPAHTSVAACASGLHALHRAAAAVRRAQCARALVIAADASLHPLFEASFERLGVLAAPDVDGVRRCQPFSEIGAGFFLIEAAAAVMVESPQTLPGETPAAWLENSWIGADSTNLIALDPDTESLRAGLAAVRSGTPAFVHAHAAGTAHDRHERAAIRSAFGDVPVFSHKKYLGHSLGAAGLVGVVISALCHREGHTPEGVAIPPRSGSITIAQGFGGHVGIVALHGADSRGRS